LIPAYFSPRREVIFLANLFSLVSKFKREFKPVTGEDCKSKGRQFTEIMQLLLRCQLTPEEYFDYRFYRSDKDYSYMLNYISNYQLIYQYRKVLEHPNWFPVLGNKLLFNLYYKNFNLPVTNVYGYYDNFAGMKLEFDSPDPLTSPEQLWEILMELKPPSIVIKPVGGGRGENVLVISKIDYTGDTISFISASSNKLSFEEIIKHLQMRTVSTPFRGYLLEEKVEQHAMLRSISDFTLNTVRIVTLLKHGHRVDILTAALRLGRDGAYVDNGSQGGLFVDINPENGILGFGDLSRQFRGGLRSDHPDTKVNFFGKQLPYWSEIKDLCIKAAKYTPFCRSVGWDVGITPEGPILIEGNHGHGLNNQALTDGFLQKEVRENLRDFGLEFYEKELPRFELSKFIKAVRIWSGYKP